MRSKLLFAGLFALMSIRCMDGQPNYTGWVDLTGCNGIVGWVADLARTDAAILVSMWEGPTMVASTVARIPRADVGAAIRDKGLHGFALSVKQDGVRHTFQLRFETSDVALGSPIVLQCGTPVIPPVVPVTPRPPLGLAVVREVPAGAIDGVNATFGLSVVANEMFPMLVFHNGLLVDPASYRVTGTTGPGAGISFLTPPAKGDNLTAIYWNVWAAKLDK